MIAWMAVAVLLSGADPCAARCTSAAKMCSDHCEKNFPKAQQAECKQACQASVPGCKEQCKKESEAK